MSLIIEEQSDDIYELDNDEVLQLQADGLFGPKQSIYVVMSPNPFNVLVSGQNLRGYCYSFQLKIGDGRDGHLRKTYSTYNADAAAIQLKVLGDLKEELDLFQLEFQDKYKGQGKQFERALFEGVAPQHKGLVRSEWYTLTVNDEAQNMELVKKLAIFCWEFAGTNQLLSSSSLASKETTVEGHTVSNFLEGLTEIISFCSYQRSPGTVVFNEPEGRVWMMEIKAQIDSLNL
ncbi:hypothetical protein FRC09_015046 [Ceratobasidium sp. 395]|nr:hypothetical protein FRC09_015046 [Ceratobasidium sp. 395]